MAVAEKVKKEVEAKVYLGFVPFTSKDELPSPDAKTQKGDSRFLMVTRHANGKKVTDLLEMFLKPSGLRQRLAKRIDHSKSADRELFSKLKKGGVPESV